MNIGAILIKLFQKTNYSHYAIKVAINPTKVYYYDSTLSGGVRRRDAKEFLKHNRVTKVIPYSKKISYVMWSNFIGKHIGKSYGTLQIVGLLLMIMKVIKSNPFGKGKKRLICNELIVLMLNHFNGTNIKDTDSLDLNDTEKILKKVLR